jgi:hypothetical protein
VPITALDLAAGAAQRPQEILYYSLGHLAFGLLVKDILCEQKKIEDL